MLRGFCFLFSNFKQKKKKEIHYCRFQKKKTVIARLHIPIRKLNKYFGARGYYIWRVCVRLHAPSFATRVRLTFLVSIKKSHFFFFLSLWGFAAFPLFLWLCVASHLPVSPSSLYMFIYYNSSEYLPCAY